MIGALRRAIDRVFDRISAKPLSLVVFFGSLALLIHLETSTVGQFKASAVARAIPVEHPALVTSFVENVYVRSGERIEVGAPLVDLSPYFLERELAQLNAEIEQLLVERKLARSRLVIEEERWLAPDLRRRPDQPSLAEPTEEFYRARLEVLQKRRAILQESLGGLTVTSQIAGRVALVAAPGSPVGIGTSVAAVTPNYAQEIVAFVPSDTDPAQIEVGTPVRVAHHSTRCGEPGTILRRGAAVEAMPGQLDRFFGLSSMHGMPVYISVPPACELGVGQVLTVEFPKAAM